MIYDLTSPCFGLIEFIVAVDLPDEVVSHPVVVAFENAATDHVAQVDVVLSCQ
jgi:hypothetical protein